MHVRCPCGGKYIRTDIERRWSEKYGRFLYCDTDPVKANWKCTGCGKVRTQRKRLGRRPTA